MMDVLGIAPTGFLLALMIFSVALPAAEIEHTQLRAGLQALEARMVTVEPQLDEQARRWWPDVAICAEVLRRTFASGDEIDRRLRKQLEQALAAGRARLDELAGDPPRHPSWASAPGHVLRGLRSRVDDSYQPYVLQVPEGWTPSDTAPRTLYVLMPSGDAATEPRWLAGYGDGRKAYLGRPEAFTLTVSIRGGSGFGASDTIIHEQIDQVLRDYPIDPARVIAYGFSRGGTLSWNQVTRHPDRWLAVSPGAGLTDWSSRYGPPEDPVGRALHRCSDMVSLSANLAMCPTWSHDGEFDGNQRREGDTMIAAATAHGAFVRRILIPEGGHSSNDWANGYLEAWLGDHIAAGRQWPTRVRYSTWYLRYHRCHWVSIERMRAHWRERADIAVEADPERGIIHVTTNGVERFALSPGVREHSLGLAAPFRDGQELQVFVDGNPIAVPPFRSGWSERFQSIVRVKTEDRPDRETQYFPGWQRMVDAADAGLAKRPGQCGPIDDAFCERFVVVPPEAGRAEPIDAFVSARLEQARATWREVFRGELRERPASAIDKAELAASNLVLFGTPQTNPLIERILPDLPITWSAEALVVDGVSYDPQRHLPVLIFPNPLAPDRYVVLNSGATTPGALGSDEVHSPELPDWAVLDREADQGTRAAVAAAGFFDERWRLPADAERDAE